MDLFLFSEGEPNNDGHRCFGLGCPGCKTPTTRSRITSRPDSTPTPNHNCMGPDCPRCNTKKRTSTLQARSALHKCNTNRRVSSMSVHKYAFHLISSYEASSLSDGSSRFWNPDMRVAGSPHSEPEPPHRCIMFPCNVCGKGK